MPPDPHAPTAHRSPLPHVASLLAAVLAFGALGVAAAQQDARSLVTSVAETHGVAALADTDGYRSDANVTLFGPTGEPVAQVRQVTLVDLSGAEPRFRENLYLGDALASATQFDADGAWTWTPDTGTIDLPAAQEAELRDALDRGLLGLRYGDDSVDRAETVGEATFAGATGTAVDVEIRGTEGTLLIAEDGTLAGEAYSSSQLGEVTVAYGDLRDVDGVLLPFSSEAHANGQPVLRTESETIELGVAFDDDAFAPPEGDAR